MFIHRSQGQVGILFFPYRGGYLEHVDNWKLTIWFDDLHPVHHNVPSRVVKVLQLIELYFDVFVLFLEALQVFRVEKSLSSLVKGKLEACGGGSSLYSAEDSRTLSLLTPAGTFSPVRRLVWLKFPCTEEL